MKSIDIIRSIYSKTNGIHPVSKEEFLQAIDDDPRVLTYILHYKIKKDILTITYNPHCPANYGEVLVDHHDGFFTLYPKKDKEKILLVSKHNDFLSRFNGNVNSEIGVASYRFFGLRSADLRYKIYTIIPFFDEANKDLFEKEYFYSQKEAKRIGQYLTANKQMPSLIKVYLAARYMMKNYSYDLSAMRYIAELNQQGKPLEIGKHHCNSSYGIFYEKKGVCGGLTHAFNRILLSMGVEAKQMTGNIKPTFFSSGGPHSWSAVNLDGRWYHIDITAAISSHYVFACFLRTNDQMAERYQWDHALPNCDIHYDINKVKSWLNEHKEELVSKGIDRKYIWWF